MRKKEHIQTIEPDKLLFTSAALKALIIPLIIEQVLAVLVGMAEAPLAFFSLYHLMEKMSTAGRTENGFFEK